MEPVLLPHEHVFSRFRGSDIDTVAELLRLSLMAASARGVRDIVDLTPYTSPRFYKDLVADTGVRVHGCVGYYLESTQPRRVRQQSASELAGALVRKARRNAKHVSIAALKVAARHAKLTPFEKRAILAVSLAARELNLPIVTHSPDGARAHVDLLMQSGVNPDRILVSHPELGLKGKGAREYRDVLGELVSLTALGVSLCFTDIYPSASSADRSTLQLIVDLVGLGRADRLMVSGDQAWKVDRTGAHFTGSPRRRQEGFALALESRLKLSKLGLTKEHLQTIFSDNPYAFYGIDKPDSNAAKVNSSRASLSTDL